MVETLAIWVLGIILFLFALDVVILVVGLPLFYVFGPDQTDWARVREGMHREHDQRVREMDRRHEQRVRDMRRSAKTRLDEHGLHIRAVMDDAGTVTEAFAETVMKQRKPSEMSDGDLRLSRVLFKSLVANSPDNLVYQAVLKELIDELRSRTDDVVDAEFTVAKDRREPKEDS